MSKRSTTSCLRRGAHLLEAIAVARQGCRSRRRTDWCSLRGPESGVLAVNELHHILGRSVTTGTRPAPMASTVATDRPSARVGRTKTSWAAHKRDRLRTGVAVSIERTCAASVSSARSQVGCRRDRCRRRSRWPERPRGRRRRSISGSVNTPFASSRRPKKIEPQRPRDGGRRTAVRNRDAIGQPEDRLSAGAVTVRADARRRRGYRPRTRAPEARGRWRDRSSSSSRRGELWDDGAAGIHQRHQQHLDEVVADQNAGTRADGPSQAPHHRVRMFSSGIAKLDGRAAVSAASRRGELRFGIERVVRQHGAVGELVGRPVFDEIGDDRRRAAHLVGDARRRRSGGRS